MNNYFIAGFIAGEGCFSSRKCTNNNGMDCYFVIETHIRDTDILNSIQMIFNHGKVVIYPGRPNICRYRISGVKNCRELIIPFMDKYLIGSYKKTQYKEWKSKVLAYKFRRELSTHKSVKIVV